MLQHPILRSSASDHLKGWGRQQHNSQDCAIAGTDQGFLNIPAASATLLGMWGGLSKPLFVGEPLLLQGSLHPTPRRLVLPASVFRIPDQPQHMASLPSSAPANTYLDFHIYKAFENQGYTHFLGRGNGIYL